MLLLRSAIRQAQEHGLLRPQQRASLKYLVGQDFLMPKKRELSHISNWLAARAKHKAHLP